MALLASLKSICNFNSIKNNNNIIILNNTNNSSYGLNNLSKLPPGYYESSSFQTKGYVVQYPTDGAPMAC